jgi:hypothetical protein
LPSASHVSLVWLTTPSPHLGGNANVALPLASPGVHGGVSSVGSGTWQADVVPCGPNKRIVKLPGAGSTGCFGVKKIRTISSVAAAPITRSLRSPVTGSFTTFAGVISTTFGSAVRTHEAIPACRT